MKLIEWDFLVVLVLLPSYVEYNGYGCKHGNYNSKNELYAVTSDGIGEEICGDTTLESITINSFGSGVRSFVGIGVVLGAVIGHKTKRVGAGINGSASAEIGGSFWGGGRGSIWTNKKKETDEETQGTIGIHVNGESANQGVDIIQGEEQGEKEEGEIVENGIAVNGTGGDAIDATKVESSWEGTVGENSNVTKDFAGVNEETLGVTEISADKEERNSEEGREDNSEDQVEEDDKQHRDNPGIEVNANVTSVHGNNGTIEEEIGGVTPGENDNETHNVTHANEETLVVTEGSVDSEDENGVEDGGGNGLEDVIEIGEENVGGNAVEVNESGTSEHGNNGKIEDSSGGDTSPENGDGTKNATQTHVDIEGEIEGSADNEDENGEKDGGGSGLEEVVEDDKENVIGNANVTSEHGNNEIIEDAISVDVLGENGNITHNLTHLNEEILGVTEGSEDDEEENGEEDREGTVVEEAVENDKEAVEGISVDVNANVTSEHGNNGATEVTIGGDASGEKDNGTSNETQLVEETVNKNEESKDIGEVNGKADKGGKADEVNANVTGELENKETLKGEIDGDKLRENGDGTQNTTQATGVIEGEIEGSAENEEENSEKEGEGNDVEEVEQNGKEDVKSNSVEVNANVTSEHGNNGSIEDSIGGESLGENGDGTQNTTHTNGGIEGEIEGSADSEEQNSEEEQEGDGVGEVEVNGKEDEEGRVNVNVTSEHGNDEIVGGTIDGDALGENGNGTYNASQTHVDIEGDIEGSVESGGENGKEDEEGIEIEVNLNSTGGQENNGTVTEAIGGDMLGENGNGTRKETQLVDETFGEIEESVENGEEYDMENGGNNGTEINTNGTDEQENNTKIEGTIDNDSLVESGNGTNNINEVHGEMDVGIESGEENGKEDRGGIVKDVNAVDTGEHVINGTIVDGLDEDILEMSGTQNIWNTQYNGTQNITEIQEEAVDKIEESKDIEEENDDKGGGNIETEVNSDVAGVSEKNTTIEGAIGGETLGEKGNETHNLTHVNEEILDVIEESAKNVEENDIENEGGYETCKNSNATSDKSKEIIEVAINGGALGENGNGTQNATQILKETVGESAESKEIGEEKEREDGRGNADGVNANVISEPGNKGTVEATIDGYTLVENDNETLNLSHVSQETGATEGSIKNEEEISEEGGGGHAGNEVVENGKEDVGGNAVEVITNVTSDHGNNGTIEDASGGDTVEENGNGTHNLTQLNEESLVAIEGSAGNEQANGREDGGKSVLEVNADGEGGLEINRSTGDSVPVNILVENTNATHTTQIHSGTVSQIKGSVGLGEDDGRDDAGNIGIDVNVDGISGQGINGSIGGAIGSDILGENGNGTIIISQIHGETLKEIADFLGIGEENGEGDGEGIGIEVNGDDMGGISGIKEVILPSFINGENGKGTHNTTDAYMETLGENEGGREIGKEDGKENGGNFVIEITSKDAGANGMIKCAKPCDIWEEKDKGTPKTTKIHVEILGKKDKSVGIEEENGKNNVIGIGIKVNANGTHEPNLNGSVEYSFLGGVPGEKENDEEILNGEIFSEDLHKGGKMDGVGSENILSLGGGEHKIASSVEEPSADDTRVLKSSEENKASHVNGGEFNGEASEGEKEAGDSVETGFSANNTGEVGPGGSVGGPGGGVCGKNTSGEVGTAGSVGDSFDLFIYVKKGCEKGKEVVVNGEIICKVGQERDDSNEGSGDIGLPSSGKCDLSVGSSIGGSLECEIHEGSGNGFSEETLVPGEEVASEVLEEMVNQHVEVQGGQENGTLIGGNGGIGVSTNDTLDLFSSFSGKIDGVAN